MKLVDMSDRSFEWDVQSTEEGRELFDKICEFRTLFSDMLFSDDSTTKKMVQCQRMIEGNWEDAIISLPEVLDFFSYDWFWFEVKDIGDDFNGIFNCDEQKLTISTASVNDDSVILHEMIHLHEFVLNSLPLFYHDAVLWCLYKDLSKRIPDLDTRIETHGHLLNSDNLYETGGLHDILFLLKSFDLDLRRGYKLGTVFGYGMAETETDKE